MANLNGQNIGTNYKGILNLNTLNGNLSATLQAVTDGDGNASPLTLSTDEVGISRTIVLSAGSSNVRLINETYTINNSGAQSGTATGIFLNATETALNGMTHNLMDLQRNGVSQFRVGSQGNVTSIGSIGLFTYNSYFQFISAGGALNSAGTYESVTAWTIDGGGTYLLRLKHNNIEKLTVNNAGTIAWGTTNAFPAIKRNGAAIDFRLADDSGFCAIRCSTLSPAYIDMGNTGIYLSLIHI